MANQSNIARPYAKALFEYAVEQHELAAWTSWLKLLSDCMASEALMGLIKNPSITPAALADMIVGLVRELATSSQMRWMVEVESLLRLLVQNKRLSVLPAIALQYNALRASQEKTLVVEITSFLALTTEQISRLVDVLSRHFKRQVTVVSQVDSTLLGGVIVRAQNVVIDGSIRGQLNKLSADLAL